MKNPDNKFGFHNPTRTTEYANKLMAQGYEVEDASIKHHLSDSLIVTHLQQYNGSFHITIPNAEINNPDKGQFTHFIFSPYDNDLGDTDGVNYQVIPTFEGVIKELTK